MNWQLSRFRAGDLVAVRSKEEILSTLDSLGRLEGLAFMPEMLQYCGMTFRVAAVAHKTCDMIGTPGTLRRMNTAVHLEGVRCDGSGHDGCEAFCNLFWKDAWLKLADKTDESRAGEPRRGCTEAELIAATRVKSGPTEAGTRYACQATVLFDATQPLPRWDLRHFIYDVLTRNRSLASVLRNLFLASLRAALPHVAFGYRAFRAFHDAMHRRLTGRAAPCLHGKVPQGQPTPVASLGLQPGEWVRIKTQQEIEQTVDIGGRNRGLLFDPEEMGPFCGGKYRVNRNVRIIIDERNGRMLRMKQPCIILEGVVCKSAYATGRLNCPREYPSFWRELWLERDERLPAEPSESRAANRSA